MKLSLIPINLTMLLLAIISPSHAGTVTVIPSNQANSLPLAGQGGIQNTQIIKVGTINLSTTSQNGFTLNITANNLANSDGETPIPFQITTFPNNSGTPGSADFTTPSDQTYSYINPNPNASEMRDLYIKYTPTSLQDPGTYSSFINLTLFDNNN